MTFKKKCFCTLGTSSPHIQYAFTIIIILRGYSHTFKFISSLTIEIFIVNFHMETVKFFISAMRIILCGLYGVAVY